MDVFRPSEGSVLDLQSLTAIAEVPGRLLDAALGVLWPGCTGLVLDGLALAGDPAPVGPPGTVRLAAGSEGVQVSPGRAILTGRDGRLVVDVPEPLHVRWPGAAGPGTRGVLVLVPTIGPGDQGVRVARERIGAALRFARPEQVDQPYVLPLASPAGNGQDWITDLFRVLQPDTPAMLTLLKRFERLEQAVWRAEPEGSVWDRQVLGRNWVRYQTAAAAAIHAARMVLVARPSTTRDRVRVLGELHRQLVASVEPVAADLRAWFGPPDGAGPYRAILGDGSTAA